MTKEEAKKASSTLTTIEAPAIWGIAKYFDGGLKSKLGILYETMFIDTKEVSIPRKELKGFIPLPIFNVQRLWLYIYSFDVYNGNGWLMRYKYDWATHTYRFTRRLHCRKNVAYGKEIGLGFGIFYYRQKGKSYKRIKPCQTLDGIPCAYGTEEFKA